MSGHTNTGGKSHEIDRPLAALHHLLVAAGIVHDARAQGCATHLVETGPTDPLNGFPRYYVDPAGLALQPCL